MESRGRRLWSVAASLKRWLPSAAKPAARHDAGRESLVRSNVFDTQFYAAQSGLAPDVERCVDHYLSVGFTAGLRANRFFDGAAYLARYPDVAAAGVDPLLHFVTFGMSEGRETTSPADCIGHMRSITDEALLARRFSIQARARGWSAHASSPWRGKLVAVYASSRGNFFFRHIADRVADGLHAIGAIPHRLDQDGRRPKETAIDVIVAPHEFFWLGKGAESRRFARASTTVLLNTEQPGTSWYFRALAHAGRDTMFADVSPQSAVTLGELGFPRSGHLPLGFTPPVYGALKAQPTLRRVRGLHLPDAIRGVASPPPPEEWRQRPIDVSFVGTLTSRRATALGRLASTLAQYRCLIHAPIINRGPLTGGEDDFALEHSIAVARHSKVILNIHRDDFPYLEWHRVVMMGIEQGAIVLSEPCLSSPGIVQGRHFVTSEIAEMPATLTRLLESPEGDAVARQANARWVSELQSEFDLRVELGALSFLHDTHGGSHA
jgi:hypothetical protein